MVDDERIVTEDEFRSPPISDLDFQSQTINPQWGQKDNVSKEFMRNVVRYKPYLDAEGNQRIDDSGNKLYVIQSVWNDLAMFTRDYRLAYLDEGSLDYCSYMTDLGYDCKQMGYIEAYSICSARTAVRLELSQSKGGFLRKILNTLINQKFEQTIEPQKKGLFGNTKNGGGLY